MKAFRQTSSYSVFLASVIVADSPLLEVVDISVGLGYPGEIGARLRG